MTDKTADDRSPDAEGESLAELFHLVRSLVPPDQKLVTVSPFTTVAEALALMRAHNYSQLPVAVGGEVFGMVSYRSLVTRLLEMGTVKGDIGDLLVSDFVEKAAFAEPSDTWEAVLKDIEELDAVLVGSRHHLEGVLTPMDVLAYLRQVANPFVMLAEIELSLRRLIRARVSDEELDACIRESLSSKYDPEEMPTDLGEMTFNDYIQIICHPTNWHHFQVVFGEGPAARSRATSRLMEVRALRNDVFHFRRTLKASDHRRLAQRRDWLEMHVRGYEASQRAAAKPRPVESKGRKWNETSFFEALSAAFGPGAEQTARSILTWASGKGMEIWYGQGAVHGSYVPILHHKSIKHQLGAVYTFGTVEIYFQFERRKPPFDSEAKRRELLARLNAIEGYPYPMMPSPDAPAFHLRSLRTTLLCSSCWTPWTGWWRRSERPRYCARRCMLHCCACWRCRAGRNETLVAISLRQVLDLVGKLDDSPGEETPRERFRRFLQDNVHDTGQLRDYIEECLRTPGDQYNRALQDLVNHLGHLLGFEVTFGRYQGVQGQIGFDGHWVSSTDKFHIVVEVKTTEVYAVEAHVLTGYVDALISSKEIPSWKVALGLCVIGRPDPELKQLENAIIAERRTHQLRVISVNSLLTLAELMARYDVRHQDILALLRPSGPTIDPVVDLLERMVAGAGAESPTAPSVRAVRESPAPAEPEGGEVGAFWLTPLKSIREESAEECIRTLVERAGACALGKNTPGRKHIKPGDWTCFYATGTGVIAHARVASAPEYRPHPKVIHPEEYPWVFRVDAARLYLGNPVVIDADLRAGLDAFAGRDPTGSWAWFVQGTKKVSEHDFRRSTRGG